MTLVDLLRGASILDRDASMPGGLPLNTARLQATLTSVLDLLDGDDDDDLLL